MAITPEELPQLIAAAVKKAVEEKQIDQKSLDALLKRPVTLGLMPAPEAQAAAGKTADSIINLPIRLGFHFNTLEDIKNLSSAKTPER